jgi:hypothetical protein
LSFAHGESHTLLKIDDERDAPARFKLRHHLANLTTTVIACATGLFLGGLVAYFGVWAIYSVLYNAGMVGRLSCGGGSALAVLTLIAGANIGSVCGGIFGFAHRIYKPEGCRA